MRPRPSRARTCAAVIASLLVVAAGAGVPGVAAAAAPVAAPPVGSPPPPAGATVDAVVDALVAEALAANLELAASDAEVARRLAGLDEARARYLPSLDFDARYSRADGGRTIDFPVGDLLNPVYATLNQLTGGTRFPAIANQRIDFLRPRDQDTKVTLAAPIYDARLGAGLDAARAERDAGVAARDALRGRLARDVRQGYYRWLRARAQVDILDATLELARENLRVNESLYRNGKITRDLVFRAEADVLEVEQTRLAADNGRRLARSWVNLLRAAPFDRELPVATVADPDVARLRDALASRAGTTVVATRRSGATGGPTAGAATLAAADAAPGDAAAALQDLAVARRAEFRELDAAAAAAAAGERLARAAFRPRLAFAVDAGSQGEGYDGFRDGSYVLASLVLRFNLYAGGADRAGIRAARAAQAQVRATRELAEQRVRLEVEQAFLELDVAEASLVTAAKRLEAAEGAFRIVSRKRDLGQVNQVEFVDARRVLTDARLNLNVTRFQALDALAQLEYALGHADRSGP